MTGTADGRGDTDSLTAADWAAAPGGLRRFARPRRPVTGNAATGATPDEHCELCGTRIGSEHAHMVDLRRRSIACACRSCALLFARPGGLYRTVPERVCHDPNAPLTAAEWAELQIPVAIAFFFLNSALGRVVASYPSPAGVTECELDLAAWDRLAAGHPLLRTPTADVEAILVVGGGPRDTAGIESFLVPIDVCYSLAGALRLAWHGFDGGDEVKRIIADLLATLRQRARVLDSGRSAAPAGSADSAGPAPEMTGTTSTRGPEA